MPVWIFSPLLYQLSYPANRGLPIETSLPPTGHPILRTLSWCANTAVRWANYQKAIDDRKRRVRGSGSATGRFFTQMSVPGNNPDKNTIESVFPIAPVPPTYGVP